MLLYQLEELESECVALACGLGDIAPAFQAEKHTKYFRDGPLELARYLTFGEPARLMRKQLDHVEALLERRSGIGGLFVRAVPEHLQIILRRHSMAVISTPD
jgi:hypothetical protein